MNSNSYIKVIVASIFVVSAIGAHAADKKSGLSAFIAAKTQAAQAPQSKSEDNSERKNGCGGLPSQAQLKAALTQAVADESSGLNLDMWATIVDRDGVVCAVAYSGANRGAQWPGSRVISAQKANTANAFSLDGLSLATANLYSASQGTSQVTPLGGSLYGLQFSNPVDPEVAYGGNPANAGTTQDGMVGKRVGGVNVFGGGLALYNANSKVVGAVGVSGDTSCADHNIGWRVRNNLKLDYLAKVGGVSGDPARPDNMILDGVNNKAGDPAAATFGGAGLANGITDLFEQPSCLNTVNPNTLPAVR